jgi:hypothetical protein
MTELSLALLADGASDRALVPVLLWALRCVSPSARFFGPEFEVRHGDLGEAIEGISQKLRPDILFVHRDAERESLETRREEIPMVRSGVVRVVPVRMTEAWFLVDERAIRKAAGNPNGRVDIDLPAVSQLESLPNPKDLLRELLLLASEHASPRRRQRFMRDIGHCVHLVAQYTEDFAPLRQLRAYRAFEEDLRRAVHPDLRHPRPL